MLLAELESFTLLLVSTCRHREVKSHGIWAATATSGKKTGKSTDPGKSVSFLIKFVPMSIDVQMRSTV